MDTDKNNNKTEKIFIDPHIHLFNLSHAGLLAYINRFLQNISFSYKDLFKIRRLVAIVVQLIVNSFFKDKKKSKRAVIIRKSIIVYLLLICLFIIILSISSVCLCSGKTPNIILLNFLFIFKVLIVTGIMFLLTLFIKPKQNKGAKKKKKSGIIKKAINLFSVMENDIGSSLELLELDILDLDSKLKDKILKTLNKKNRREFDFQKLLDKGHIKDERENIINIIKKYLGKDNKNGVQLEISSYNNKETVKQQYNQYIMTPLIVDFGYKKYDLAGIHYNSPPSKPVVAQTKDVLEGIKNYHNNSNFDIFEIYPFMGINPNRYDWDDTYIDDNEPGLTDKKCNDAKGKELEGNSLNKMMNKYFASFEKNDLAMIRLGKFKEKAKDYSGNLDEDSIDIIFKKDFHDELEEILNSLKKEEKPDDIIEKLQKGIVKQESASEISTVLRDKDRNKIIKSIEVYLLNKVNDNKMSEYENFYNYFFTGIKVYPPLGFDPWPKKNNNNQQKKVEYIYCYCQKRGIPIVTHCNNGGFIIDDMKNIEKFTNPKRWKCVLENYPELRLNFAHLGGDHVDAKKWRETIFTYCIEYENVYTDFSCMCFNNDDYIKLNKQINTFLSTYSKNKPNTDEKKVKDKLYQRIMYGTDFSINLKDETDSYKDYLNEFLKTKAFCITDKDLFSQDNPMRFLFDKTIPHNKKQNHGNNKQKRHDC